MDTIKILGCGYQPGDKKVTNQDLEAIMDTSDEWIRQRTGIQSRYINETSNTSDLAVQAAQKALKDAGIEGKSLSYIIVATLTPDCFTPSTACLVQSKLGLNEYPIAAFDLNAACSGFVYALKVAAGLLETGQKALVIGAETLSKIIDWSDRSTAVLFGDGAGACIIEKNEEGKMYSFMQSAGDENGVLRARGARLQNLGQENLPQYSYLEMQGKEVFRFAVSVLPKAINEVLKKAGWQKEEVGLFICHQANMRILDYAAKKMQIEKERFFINLDQYGNTSAASIPMALAQAKEQGILQKGMKIVLAGFGAGLTYAAIAIEWQGED
jgi:3-oxoacyl-[acyl-carrier-protein] synthase-3